MYSRLLETRSRPASSPLPSRLCLLCRFSEKLHSTSRFCPSMLLSLNAPFPHTLRVLFRLSHSLHSLTRDVFYVTRLPSAPFSFLQPTRLPLQLFSSSIVRGL